MINVHNSIASNNISKQVSDNVTKRDASSDNRNQSIQSANGRESSHGSSSHVSVENRTPNKASVVNHVEHVKNDPSVNKDMSVDKMTDKLVTQVKSKNEAIAMAKVVVEEARRMPEFAVKSQGENTNKNIAKRLLG